jgi:isochorismate synthase
MSYFFEKIREQLNKQYPFVCYCKPNSDVIISLLQNNDSLVSWNVSDVGFVFVSFDNEKRFIIPESQSDILYEKTNVSEFIYPNNRILQFDEFAKIEFETLVDKALFEIEAGTFEKVVLSRTEVIALNNFDIEVVFNKLVTNYQGAFKYCFYHPAIGLWIGASPEPFLKFKENKITTIALAGTQEVSDGQCRDWEEKEINEHKIVSDFIVNNLSKFSNSVIVSQPYNFKAGELIHIKTDIEALINYPFDIEPILNIMHPTPAVCGYPKAVSREFILKEEGYDREFYAGFLGEWNKDFQTFTQGNCDLFVNLRCMKINSLQATLYVGCGINKGSIPEKEFIETFNKSQTMKKVL